MVDGATGGIERRRSRRTRFFTRLILRWRRPDGLLVQEEVQTEEVNAFGALLRMRADLQPTNVVELRHPRTNQSVRAQIVAQRGLLDPKTKRVAVALEIPSATFWEEGLQRQDALRPPEVKEQITRQLEELPDEARVMGLALEERQKAYLISMLENHPLINDQMGEHRVVIFRPRSQGAIRVFLREAADVILTFEVNPANPDELTDSETQSRWDASGKCLEGPLEGHQMVELSPLPTVWSSWVNMFPYTELYIAPDS